jgi:hypothetical protein
MEAAPLRTIHLRRTNRNLAGGYHAALPPLSASTVTSDGRVKSSKAA